MKKLLSTLLALTMIFACVSPVFADDDDGDVRDTSFFTEQTHGDINYGDIEYEYIDPAPFLEEVDALKELAKDASKAAEFEERFLTLKDELYRMYAMYVLLDNKTYHDAKDEWAADELAKVDEDTTTAGDAFTGLIRDVLKLDNACSKVLSSKLSEDDIADYLDYEDMTDEEKALSNKETELESKYRVAIVELDDVTTTIDGEEYNADDLYQAYYVDGAISLEDYLAGNHECYGTLADIYLEMIDVRNQIARLNGYDNYAEYAYAEVYNRDYTVEEIAAFRAAVKKYLAPALMNHMSYLPSVDADALPLDASAYTGDNVFDTLAPYFGQLSDELLESAQYIHEHGSYDLDPAPNKTGTAFSGFIYYYNMPFFFNNAYGTYTDLTTAIHELGHNNNTYWMSHDWNDASTDIDTAEVHSQALELLMTKFYPELFGTQSGAVAQNTAFDILYSVVQGSMHDELQCYAYSTPNVTAVMLNEKYRQIAEEYSLVSSADPRPEMYGWYGIPHTFTSPMYYISYATSAAGAFTFWEEAQDDYFAAVDHYFEFVSQSPALGFQETFEAVGMESPLSPAYIQELGKTAHDKLMFVNPYTDVYTDMWYAEPIYVVNYYGLMNGVSDDKFAPDDMTTCEQAVTILARMLDEREDAEEPYTIDEGVAWALENGIASEDMQRTAVLTRENFAVMLCNLAAAMDVDVFAKSDLSGFSDAAQVSDWAQNALAWAAENGVINGMGNGTIDPQGGATRAQLAAMLLRFAINVLP